MGKEKEEEKKGESREEKTDFTFYSRYKSPSRCECIPLNTDFGKKSASRLTIGHFTTFDSKYELSVTVLKNVCSCQKIRKNAQTELSTDINKIFTTFTNYRTFIICSLYSSFIHHIHQKSNIHYLFIIIRKII